MECFLVTHSISGGQTESESPSVLAHRLSPLKIRQGIVIPWLVLSLSRVVVDVIKDVAN